MAGTRLLRLTRGVRRSSPRGRERRPTSLLVVGFWFRSNTDEDLYVFGTLATIFTFTGVYCLGAGAVARGIQLARR